MHHVKRFAIIVTGLVMMASCKKTNTQGRMIPNTAAIVLHINGSSLSEKLPWTAIKDNPLFNELYDDSSVAAIMKKLLDNPENSGIDIKKDMLFFTQKALLLITNNFWFEIASGTIIISFFLWFLFQIEKKDIVFIQLKALVKKRFGRK